jgi:DNA-binding GntR family transcriptional regulator
MRDILYLRSVLHEAVPVGWRIRVPRAEEEQPVKSNGADIPARARARHQQLPEEVAAYVREQILSGNLRPGEFLRMEPIAEAVGVSITPVREGLLSLSTEGLITLLPRRGFVVAAFTRQHIRDLFWAQSQLSGELAARAAERITPQELDRLTDLVAECEAAIQRGDVDEIGRLGHEFHRTINLAADSDGLARLLANIVKHLPNHFYASIEAHVKTAAPQHEELIEALRKQDSRRARNLTEAHIIENADYVIEMLEKRGLWTDEVAAGRPAHLRT